MNEHPDNREKRPASKPAQLDTELLVLGIESSCDETAAAIVRRHPDGRGELLSNIVKSQWEQHQEFGGVVPELAARAHVTCLDALIAEAMSAAGLDFDRLDGVAASTGPGLVGGLIIGGITAKAISLARDIPFLSVNHLEGHALTVGLTDNLRPPYVLLLVSGGHTQMLLVHDVGAYERLGTTIDDALGEAFDKTAKLLGLPQPGGPAVEQAAKNGDRDRFKFPRPMLGRKELNFSFAGLKTAVRQQAQAIAPLTEQDVADICAGFEEAVCATVVDRCRRALMVAKPKLASSLPEHHEAFVVAGGVAANQKLGRALSGLSTELGFKLYKPPLALCTDNAAMIAWTGAEHLARGCKSQLDAPVKPRWPLDPHAKKVSGAGVKA